MKLNHMVACFMLVVLVSCGNNGNRNFGAVKAVAGPAAVRPKVLYVDSYNTDYPWVLEIMGGLTKELGIKMDETGVLDQSESPVELKVVHMDTKNHKEEAFIQKAALRAKAVIEEWQPDVVIASDDNASKYLIAPYFKGHSIPIVFCGVNGDSSVYGFPEKNITGMEEVKLVDQLIKELACVAQGNKVGIIMADNLSARREVFECEKLLGYPLTQYYADTFQTWETEFLKLQQEVDILLVGNLDGVSGWDNDLEALKQYMAAHISIPTGTWFEWLNDSVLITVAVMPSEMGEWAAQTALKILDGTPPSEIPITRNKRAAVFLNMELARRQGILFPQELIDRAQLVNFKESGAE